MDTQFLFMIADTNMEDTRILSALEKIVDGENIAFIYNSSSTCEVGPRKKCMLLIPNSNTIFFLHIK